jgi:hypothetical protein
MALACTLLAPSLWAVRASQSFQLLSNPSVLLNN